MKVSPRAAVFLWLLTLLISQQGQGTTRLGEAFPHDPLYNPNNIWTDYDKVEVINEFMQHFLGDGELVHTGLDLYHGDIQGKEVVSPADVQTYVLAHSSNHIVLARVTDVGHISGNTHFGNVHLWKCVHVTPASYIDKGYAVDDRTVLGTVDDARHLHVEYFYKEKARFEVVNGNAQVASFLSAKNRWNPHLIHGDSPLAGRWNATDVERRKGGNVL